MVREQVWAWVDWCAVIRADVAERICGWLHIAAWHQLFQFHEQHHVCELISNTIGWATARGEFFSLVLPVRFHKHFLPKVKEHELRNVCNLPHLHGKRESPDLN